MIYNFPIQQFEQELQQHLNNIYENIQFCRRSHTARVHEKKRLQFSETTPLIPENDVPDSCLPERRVIAEDGSLVRCLHFSSTFIGGKKICSTKKYLQK